MSNLSSDVANVRLTLTLIFAAWRWRPEGQAR